MNECGDDQVEMESINEHAVALICFGKEGAGLVWTPPPQVTSIIKDDSTPFAFELSLSLFLC